MRYNNSREKFIYDKSRIKRKAKKDLAGKWGTSVLTVLVYAIIVVAISGLVYWISQAAGLSKDATELLNSIVGILIDGTIAVGLVGYFMNIARGKDAKVNDLFSYTNLIGVVILTVILVAIFTTLWTLLLIVPGIIAAISYSQVMYIIIDDPKIDAMAAIKESKEIMNGHKMDYFVLQLSFIGWSILATITFGIGYLWLTPYMATTNANFYDSIKK